MAALVAGSIWAFFKQDGRRGTLGQVGGFARMGHGKPPADFSRPRQSDRESLGRRAFGFLGLWFFAILAPTSLVPGMSQTLAEHRMYLALTPVIVAVVLAVPRWLGPRSLGLFLALAVVF